MRLAFLAPRFHTNQTDLIRKLLQEGHEVVFLAVTRAAVEDYSSIAPIVLPRSELISRWAERICNPTHDRARTVKLSWPKVRALYRLLHDFRPDAVVVRGSVAPYMWMVLPYLLWHGVRVAIYTQGPQFRPVYPPVLRIGHWVALKVLRFRWFTCVERRVVDDGGGDMIQTPVCFIPFFKYVSQSSRQRSYDLAHPRILAVGKFYARKNFLNLVEAFARVQAVRRCYLTLIGELTGKAYEEYFRRVERRVEDLGLSDRVSLHANRSFSEVQRSYAGHDLFVLPSSGEPASVSQVEAMSHGLAVVCCVDNGTAHYVQPGFNGVHVTGSVESLVEALTFFLADAERIVEYGRNSVRLLEGPLSIELAYHRLMRLLGAT